MALASFTGSIAGAVPDHRTSLVVREQDPVEIGQRIALSGNSGNTQGEPHLHFGVYQFWPATERFDVPANFRNAEGPLDGRGGLLPGSRYKALAQ